MAKTLHRQLTIEQNTNPTENRAQLVQKGK